jgi:folylpolyglutamate synthase/dihydropteroate synthase
MKGLFRQALNATDQCAPSNRWTAKNAKLSTSGASTVDKPTKTSSTSEKLNDDITRALRKRPPCRFEVFSQTVNVPGRLPKRVNIIFDIAHNIDAIKSLIKKVKAVYGTNCIPIRQDWYYARYVMLNYLLCSVITGFCADKDVSECLDEILSLARPAHIFFVAVRGTNTLL